MARLVFCQNDSPTEGHILAKGQLDHSCTFWTMPIMIFSPVNIILGHPLDRKAWKEVNEWAFTVIICSMYVEKVGSYDWAH